jgi:hypothetical protein
VTREALPRGTATADPRRSPTLCVAIVTSGDLDGVGATVQAIRLYHEEIAGRVSFLVVDRRPEGVAAGTAEALAGANPMLRYLPSPGADEGAARDLLMRATDADIVCWLDDRALVAAGGLAAILDWFRAHPGSRDLMQGPQLDDGLVHGAPAQPAPFQLEIEQPGLLACRRDAALEPGAGRRVLCHPAAAWIKRPDANPFACFEAIFCLNLDRETERWREASRRHARLGITSRVERFPGVATPDNPHRGIAVAYRRMVAAAQRRGYEHLLVLEDDAVFLDDTLAVLASAAVELPGHAWDLCYLGACVWSQAFPFLGTSTVLQACGPVTCTHAIAVHARAYDRLLAEIPTAADELERWLEEHLAIDQYLSRRIRDGTYRAVITSPRVASQPNLLHFDDGDGALAARYVI